MYSKEVANKIFWELDGLPTMNIDSKILKAVIKSFNLNMIVRSRSSQYAQLGRGEFAVVICGEPGKYPVRDWSWPSLGFEMKYESDQTTTVIFWNDVQLDWEVTVDVEGDRIIFLPTFDFVLATTHAHLTERDVMDRILKVWEIEAKTITPEERIFKVPLPMDWDGEEDPGMFLDVETTEADQYLYILESELEPVLGPHLKEMRHELGSERFDALSRIGGVI